MAKKNTAAETKSADKTKKAPAAKAPKKTPASKKTILDKAPADTDGSTIKNSLVDHVVTTETIALNPDLPGLGINPGEVIQYESPPSVEEKPAPGISVVIPYLASAASGDELKYALRAWAENFPECQIVIIGDRPDFISDQVVHIPHVAEFASPQLDVTAKLMQAIASDLISEDFILTNDDIYPVNHIELADIAELKSAGFLGSTKRNANPKYMAKLLRTKDLLEARKLPIHDYSTHTPYLLNKTRLAKVIARYKADQEPLLISSLYFNTCFPKEVPQLIKGGPTGELIAYVYRSNPNLDILEEAFLNRKFINHNSEGYPAVRPFLEQFFPDKSRFEL